MGELNANSSNAKVRTYVWGLDLSGSEQGAGGVGGLLKVTDYTSGTTHHFVGYDGNGNVAALFDGTTGAATARYEYGPFGEPLRTTGTMAEKCPFRFSTKYTDSESGLVYYGYRFYNTQTGRWLSRDPAEDQHGMNLYLFCNGDPIDGLDYLGLSIIDNWKKLPSEAWNSFCMKFELQLEFRVKDPKTQRINGCKFACCPLPASVFGTIAQVLLNKQSPLRFEKKCPEGRVCCNEVSQSEPIPEGEGFPFSIETGPHIGENGTVRVHGVDITPILEKFGNYKKTTAKTTCLFSGMISFHGVLTVSAGDCIEPL